MLPLTKGEHYNFGLLPQISSEIPVGMGAAARRILHAAAPFMKDNYSFSLSGWEFNSGQASDIGPFTIVPFLVDHSAYDSYALMIKCDGKTVFYSGDFRSHGRKAKLFSRLIENFSERVDLLLLEGTTLLH